MIVLQGGLRYRSFFFFYQTFTVMLNVGLIRPEVSQFGLVTIGKTSVYKHAFVIQIRQPQEQKNLCFDSQ